MDDDENSRESLRDIIKLRGHECVVLDEGMKCVNRCSETKFDIIFMDYHINELDAETQGELDGTDVIKIIRECFDIWIQVYAYTGDCTEKALNDFKHNMNGAFIKPIDPQLINDFFKIIENNPTNTTELKKLALKRKNFKYFGQKQKINTTI